MFWCKHCQNNTRTVTLKLFHTNLTPRQLTTKTNRMCNRKVVQMVFTTGFVSWLVSYKMSVTTFYLYYSLKHFIMGSTQGQIYCCIGRCMLINERQKELAPLFHFLQQTKRVNSLCLQSVSSYCLPHYRSF